MCERGAVRLVNDDGETREGMESGQVEMCWNNTWTKVCDGSWTDSNAATLCIELGFYGESSLCMTSVVTVHESSTAL